MPSFRVSVKCLGFVRSISLVGEFPSLGLEMLLDKASSQSNR